MMPAEPSRYASMVVAPRGYITGVVAPVPPTSLLTISHHFFTSFPTAKK
jgi:hypothetical protein